MTLLLLLLAVLSCGLIAAVHGSIGFSDCAHSFVDGYIPYQPSGTKQICKADAIAISYDVTMIDPAWSAYFVTPDEANHEISGRENFYEDPDLIQLGVTQAPVDSDAFNTSWNRGHVAPNHILSYTEDVKHGTFSMANVAPQEAIFNQQSWNKLEEHVWSWIKDKEYSLYIVTGVAFKSRSHPRRTFNNIAVPDFYFKVICDPYNHRSAGFYGDNNVGGKADTFYTVEEVEAIYGGSLLPKDTCNTGTVNPTQWWTF